MNDLHTILARTLLQLGDDYDHEFAARLGEWMERAGTLQELRNDLTAMTQLYVARIEEMLTVSNTSEADRMVPMSPADIHREAARLDQ